MTSISFPCIDCITLSVCKTFYNSKISELQDPTLQDTGHQLMMEGMLMQRCSLLKNWVYSLNGKKLMSQEWSTYFHGYYKDQEKLL